MEIVSGAVFSRYVIKKFEQVFKVNTEKSTKFGFFQRRLGNCSNFSTKTAVPLPFYFAFVTALDDNKL